LMNNLSNFMKINAIDNDFSLTDDQWMFITLGLTHLRYKIKNIQHCDWFSVLDSWRFNAIGFSVQPRKSYTCNEVHKRTVQRIVKKLQKRIAKNPIPVLSLLIIFLRIPFGSNLKSMWNHMAKKMKYALTIWESKWQCREFAVNSKSIFWTKNVKLIYWSRIFDPKTS